MCGICGTVGFSDRTVLRSMCDALIHRGPDGSDLFVDATVGLGSTRLAMIDLSRSTQPAHNEDGSIHLVFNGEMYNYRPWIRRLEELGHRFYSKGDTEVLVHLYEEYGLDFVRRLRGMFALAIWDANARRAILARDRFGVKPLYYAQTGSGTIFSSELMSLAPYVPHEVDRGLISFYLRMRYFPFDRSPLVAVRKVPPGHLMVFDENGVRTLRYWDIRETTPLNGQSVDPLALERLFCESVRLRLVSDVPLGVFLSGGLDSSAIVAAMSSLRVPSIHTFSVGFGESYDETPAARVVAENFGTDHTEIQLSNHDVVDLIPQVLGALDEPIADPATVPTYALSAAANRKVKGVLLGEGADEVFGGYEQYRALWVSTRRQLSVAGRLAARLPDPLLRPILRYASPLATTAGSSGMTQARHALAATNPSEIYLGLAQVFSEDELPRTVRTTSTLDAGRWVASYFRSTDPVRDAQIFDLENFMVHLLDRTDRMTMAHSIEGREPFLDHPMVEYSLSFPAVSRVGIVREKRALRRSLAPLLPHDVLGRRKRRFFVPLPDWFRGELGSYFDEVMQSPSLPLLTGEELAALRGRLSTLPLRGARQMWSVLCLELWYRQLLSVRVAS